MRLRAAIESDNGRVTHTGPFRDVDTMVARLRGVVADRITLTLELDTTEDAKAAALYVLPVAGECLKPKG